ncbi:MAG TPA: hypothetical protein VN739_07815 [Nitrososphaerales archaeon]|nr:hypothetical protein [Nitrososphaerales archaeon]
MSTKQERGISSVRERIKRSQNRTILQVNDSRLRDLNEIWETYYDTEEAILISKIIFGGFDKPGKIRKLNAPANFDFSRLSDLEIRAKFEIIGKNLSLAENNIMNRLGNETIEHLRIARDELKIMLLSPEKVSRKLPGTKRSRRRVRR